MITSLFSSFSRNIIFKNLECQIQTRANKRGKDLFTGQIIKLLPSRQKKHILSVGEVEKEQIK